jgi:hypothetical protein
MFGFLPFKMRWKYRLFSRSMKTFIRASAKGPSCGMNSWTGLVRIVVQPLESSSGLIKCYPRAFNRDEQCLKGIDTTDTVHVRLSKPFH